MDALGSVLISPMCHFGGNLDDFGLKNAADTRTGCPITSDNIAIPANLATFPWSSLPPSGKYSPQFKLSGQRQLLVATGDN